MLAGGGWLPLVAIIQCFVQGVTGTRLLLDPHMDLVGKSRLLLDWQSPNFCAQLGQRSINLIDLVLRSAWRWAKQALPELAKLVHGDPPSADYIHLHATT
jgi:hypothetical protein